MNSPLVHRTVHRMVHRMVVPENEFGLPWGHIEGTRNINEFLRNSLVFRGTRNTNEFLKSSLVHWCFPGGTMLASREIISGIAEARSRSFFARVGMYHF